MIDETKGFAPPIPYSALEAWKRVAAGTHVNAGGDVLPGINEVDKSLSDARYEGGYHWRNGIYFKRLEGGAVEVRHFVDWNSHASCVRWIIPKSEWASLIAAVSAQGETSEKYQDALGFHTPVRAEQSEIVASERPETPPAGHNQATPGATVQPQARPMKLRAKTEGAGYFGSVQVEVYENEKWISCHNAKTDGVWKEIADRLNFFEPPHQGEAT